MNENTNKRNRWVVKFSRQDGDFFNVRYYPRQRTFKSAEEAAAYVDLLRKDFAVSKNITVIAK